MLPQQYCLRWKYHHSNLQTMFSQLLDRGCFCDVTLACEGQLIQAHRVVLCACSSFFDNILTNCTTERNPIIIFKDAKFTDVKYLVEFMYKGEINVEHANLASLLRTAEDLKIKGLAEVSLHNDDIEPTIPDSSEQQPKRNDTASMSQQQKFDDENRLQQQQQHSMPVLTPVSSPVHQDNISLHLGQKRKRGRPPLDDSYDVFCTPKIAFIEGNHLSQTMYKYNNNDSPTMATISDATKSDSTFNAPTIVTNTNEQQKQQQDHQRQSQKGSQIQHQQQSNEWIENQNNENSVDSEIEEDKDEKPLIQHVAPSNVVVNDEYIYDRDSDDYGDDENVDSDNYQRDGGNLLKYETNIIDDHDTIGNISLTLQEIEEWQDVIKMDEYLSRGRRPQFWEEPFTKRIMEAIRHKKLEMKKAAQILGVSYGTLYGRYRETYGCLKHPYRGTGVMTRYIDNWPENRQNNLD